MEESWVVQIKELEAKALREIDRTTQGVVLLGPLDKKREVDNKK